MPYASSEAAVAPRPTVRSLDLTKEAERSSSYQRHTAWIGAGIGLAFAVIGAVELVLVLESGGFSGDTLIALFLLVLGVSIFWFTYRGGLKDPVARIDLDDQGATFVRRSGSSVRLAWLDPKWDLEVQDPAPDPTVREEAKKHLFFSGPGGVYGTFGRSDVGPLMDVAREHGLDVSVRNGVTGRGGKHPIRRIRIRPYR